MYLYNIRFMEFYIHLCILGILRYTIGTGNAESEPLNVASL
jgi:hypothetical protein